MARIYAAFVEPGSAPSLSGIGALARLTPQVGADDDCGGAAGREIG
jgi:hypothetical protein